MEEPYQENGVMCRFSVINLFMVLVPMVICLLQIGPGVSSTYKAPNFFLTGDHYQNNDVTCGMPSTDLVMGDGIKAPRMHLRDAVGRLVSPCSSNAFWL